MWSDNESEVDLLRFRYLSVAVTRVITTASLLPTTVGVFGDWGSGKSTLLGMIRSSLKEEEGVLPLTFNGWLFEGYEDAKTALMGTILDGIQDRLQENKNAFEKARDLLETLRKRVNWLQLMTLTGRYVVPAFLGHPQQSVFNAGQDAAKAIYEAIKEPDKKKQLSVEDIRAILQAAPSGPENHRRDIREFRKDFAELLRQADIRTLVVFIDDLDRCLPDTIIETLEAIKLFLFVPGTAFVLAADERLIEYAVRQRFPELPGTDTEVGRDYLEKLVQIPVRIPPLSGSELHAYVNLLFAQLRLDETGYERVCRHVAQFSTADLADLSFDVDAARNLLPNDRALQPLEDDLDFAAQVVPILAPGMGGNPRRTKRFLNMLILRMELGAARGLDLKRQTLAKLMLLEYLKPEFFKQLAALQAEQGGRPHEIEVAEGEIKEGASVSREAAETGDTTSRPQQPVTRHRIPDHIQPWFADQWMLRWLQSDPLLGDIDLRPYFYVAHDKIGALTGTSQRLSPRAAEVLARLLDHQPLARRLGISRSKDLSVPDAAAVFEALAIRVRQAETLSDKQSPHLALFDFLAPRPEIVPQMLALFDALPEPKIPLAVPTKIYEAANGTPAGGAARMLLGKWAGSERNKPLANSAKQTLGRAWKE